MVAGPMHDFISVDESRLTWIENQAGGSEPFRHALANVWVWRPRHVDATTTTRIERR